jgi:DNA repair exonuclease SbcCD ATPase subunit
MEDLLQVEIVQLEEELTKLKSAVEYIETAKISIESASKIINTIIKLKEEFNELSEKAYALIERMDKIDFPGRLDKIDSKILSVGNEIHSLETRIEASSKAISLELKTVSKSILSEVGTNRNDILFYLKKQSKDIKTLQLGLIGVFIIVIIIGVLFYLNIL